MDRRADARQGKITKPTVVNLPPVADDIDKKSLIKPITDFKVVYICPDHNEKYHARKLHMDALLQRIGFKDIVHYKSGTEEYPECLANATIDILTAYMNDPVLVLEDDIEWLDVSMCYVHPTADAIYFGLSRYGGDPTRNWHINSLSISLWSHTQVRVENMLATHAILYLTPTYKQDFINILTAHKGQKYNTDVLASRIQRHHTVLALKQPAFYQSSVFNPDPGSNVEYATRFRFN
jgi:hypothetical protein